MRTGIVVLAAGASVRLGRPKQLLQIKGEPLVRRIVKAALRSKADSVAVVLGAYHDAVGSALADLPVTLAFNGAWAEGMAGSLQTGLAALPPGTEGALFLTCDQPAVDARILNRILKAAGEDPLARVACAYGDTVGIPALFGKGWFPRFRDLAGDHGAKALLQGDAVVEIPWEPGAHDLDTPEDLARWSAAVR